jgi:hypothetical protein
VLGSIPQSGYTLPSKSQRRRKRNFVTAITAARWTRCYIASVNPKQRSSYNDHHDDHSKQVCNEQASAGIE